MKLNRRNFLKTATAITAGTGFALQAASKKFKTTPKNVLFICVDDLRTNIASYDDMAAITPNFDRLAKQSLQFNKAYCQMAICGPSRTSIFTGLFPDTLGVWKIGQKATAPANTTTILKHFKDNGYFTASAGKVFHGSINQLINQSTSVPHFKSKASQYYVKENVDFIEKRKENAIAAGEPKWKMWKYNKSVSTEAGPVDESNYPDYEHTSFIIKKMREKKKGPFFLTLGLNKPHLPFCAPKKYWDFYKRSQFKLPPAKAPEGAPEYAVANVTNGELHNYTDIEKDKTVPKKKALELIHGYYACVSFVDAQIGRVLDEMKKLKLDKNTLVALWSDHGFKLGDYGAWCKHTNYEFDNRIPMFLQWPGQQEGMVTDSLVESTDWFPTFCDAMGVKAPEGLEGKSMVPLLDNPEKPFHKAALSQYARGKKNGYTIRTDNFRYVQWTERTSGKIDAEELYDHRTDPGETISVASNGKYSSIMKEYRALLKEKQAGRRGMNTKGDPSDPKPGKGKSTGEQSGAELAVGKATYRGKGKGLTVKEKNGAFTLIVDKKMPKVNDLIIKIPVNADLSSGQKLKVSFKIQGPGKVKAVLQCDSPRFWMAGKVMEPGQKAENVSLTGTLKQDCEAGKANLAVHLAFKKQVIKISEIKIAVE